MFRFVVIISISLMFLKSFNGNDEFVRKLSDKIQEDFRQKLSEKIKTNSDLESFQLEVIKKRNAFCFYEQYRDLDDSHVQFTNLKSSINMTDLDKFAQRFDSMVIYYS